MFASIQASNEMNQPGSEIRNYLERRGKSWKNLDIPIEAFILIGSAIIDAMKPMIPVTKKHEQERMQKALAFLYEEAMQFALYPLLSDQNLKKEAEKFYKEVAGELRWSPQVLEQRLFEVNMEISSTGEYTHTGQELQVGARLAWRNSAKCIGR